MLFALQGGWLVRFFGLCGVSCVYVFFCFCFSDPLLSQFLCGRWLVGFSGFIGVYAVLCVFWVLAFRILCCPSSSGVALVFAAFRWFLRPLVAFLVLACRILSITSSSPASVFVHFCVYIFMYVYICMCAVFQTSLGGGPACFCRHRGAAVKEMNALFADLQSMYACLCVCTSSTNIGGVPSFPHPPTSPLSPAVFYY